MAGSGIVIMLLNLPGRSALQWSPVARFAVHNATFYYYYYLCQWCCSCFYCCQLWLFV